MNKRPGVVIFSPEYPPYILGGLGRHVEQLTMCLAESLSIELYVPAFVKYDNRHPAIHIHGIRINKEPDSPQFWVQFCHAAATEAKQCAASVRWIHCHDWTTALAGAKAREWLHKPLIYNIHLPQHAGTALIMENIGIVSADLLLVNSKEVGREIAGRGLPCRRIKVVPNGVDPAAFSPPADWPCDDGYILFVGRLVSQKGVDVLLRAFAVLLKRRPQARLVIVGDGWLELFLQRVARHLGFPDRVSFLGWKSGDSLIELYRRAQLLVVPSYYEPFGIVAVEAMACGRPVIASRVGGLRSLVRHGLQGYLVAPGDHLDLARRLIALVDYPERRREMGAAGRKLALGMSWQGIADQTIALYKGLGQPSNAPRFYQAASKLRNQLIAGLGTRQRRMVGKLLGKEREE